MTSLLKNTMLPQAKYMISPIYLSGESIGEFWRAVDPSNDELDKIHDQPQILRCWAVHPYEGRPQSKIRRTAITWEGFVMVEKEAKKRRRKKEDALVAVEWEEKLACAPECSRCNKSLSPKDQRILSVYDHEAICMDCKRKEGEHPDYKETSIAMVRQCLMDVELMPTGNPGAYCFHHFYPHSCQ